GELALLLAQLSTFCHAGPLVGSLIISSCESQMPCEAPGGGGGSVVGMAVGESVGVAVGEGGSEVAVAVGGGAVGGGAVGAGGSDVAVAGGAGSTVVVVLGTGSGVPSPAENIHSYQPRPFLPGRAFCDVGNVVPYMALISHGVAVSSPSAGKW